jgi:hypothetical protein
VSSLSMSHRLGPRTAHGILSVALLGASVAVVATTDASWWWVASTVMAPDVALFLGFGRGLAPGQLHHRAVPLYNALHHPAGPMALGALALLGVVGAGPAAAALAWGFHIAMDRAAGYGLRTRDGLQRS